MALEGGSGGAGRGGLAASGSPVTHPKVLEPKVLDLDPKVLVTNVLGSLNKGINWLYPVSDVKSLMSTSRCE